jgi:sugar lactone lactonase YvrE
MSSSDCLFSLHSSISKKQLLTKINFKNKSDRINDADIDINGQVWISTMDTKQQSDTGMIIGYNSNFDPIFKDGSYIISNGPIFDYERNIGYVTDSIKRIIYSFSIDDISANGFQKKIFLSLNDVDGNPDGMVVDKSGNLWVAMWGSGKVCCFDKNSNLKLILQLPVSKVTSCAFGGSNLNELYITTASVGLNDIEAERQPHAGKLFKFITQEQGYASNCYRSENTLNLYH